MVVWCDRIPSLISIDRFGLGAEKSTPLVLDNFRDFSLFLSSLGSLD